MSTMRLPVPQATSGFGIRLPSRMSSQTGLTTCQIAEDDRHFLAHVNYLMTYILSWQLDLDMTGGQFLGAD